MLKSRYLCPYCFEWQKINDVKFRCTNEHCALEDDAVLTKFQGFSSLQRRRKVFRSTKKTLLSMPKEAECPACHTVSQNLICSNCHSRLPLYIDTTDDKFFAIIGAKEAGKSHYIAVLIEQLKVLSDVFNFALGFATDETNTRYNNEFRKPIYESKQTIKATHSGLVDRSVREPLIYQLRFHPKNAKFKLSKDPVTLVFFDTAGEDLNDEDIMLTVNKYIYNSAGIIFLLDPLQLPAVRKSLPQGTPLPQVNTEIETIINRTTNLIRKAKKIRPEAQINIPVAVSFTKIDTLNPILDPSSILRHPSPHREAGMIDSIDFENVSMEMESMVRHWAGNDFPQHIAVNFKEFAYFGLSALGCNPHRTNIIEKVQPFRVEDPFLWLLWKQGVLK